MLSTKNLIEYTPRGATMELSKLLGYQLSAVKYYRILREHNIIDEGNNLLSPFNDGSMFWLEYKGINSPHTGKYKKTHQQVRCNYTGILFLFNLLKK